MVKAYHVIVSVTDTTTSSAINIKGAQRVSFFFQRTNHTAGKTVFSVTVSVDGTTYTTYNKLIDNVANTNQQTLTRVASYDTGTANASAIYSMSPEDTFCFLKVTATETTDGTHNAWVVIDYGPGAII
jgi:hypothetical protein